MLSSQSPPLLSQPPLFFHTRLVFSSLSTLATFSTLSALSTSPSLLLLPPVSFATPRSPLKPTPSVVAFHFGLNRPLDGMAHHSIFMSVGPGRARSVLLILFVGASPLVPVRWCYLHCPCTCSLRLPLCVYFVARLPLRGACLRSHVSSVFFSLSLPSPAITLTNANSYDMT